MRKFLWVKFFICKIIFNLIFCQLLVVNYIRKKRRIRLCFVFYFNFFNIIQMKKWLWLSYVFFGGFVWAQDIPEVQPEVVIPDIEMVDSAKLGSEVTFDASPSKLISNENGLPSFSWLIFKNGEKIDTKFGKILNYNFIEVGRYIIKLNIKQGGEKYSVERPITIYNKKAVFVTDNEDDFTNIDISAAQKGILLKKILLINADTSFSTESDFIYKFQENLDFIRAADLLIFTSKSNLGLSAFAQFWKKLSPDNAFDLKGKTIVRITDAVLKKELGLIQPVYETLHQPIVLTSKDALTQLFEATALGDFEESLKSRGNDYLMVDDSSKPSSWLPLKNLMGYFAKNGVALSIIYLLLSVPFLAFIIAFCRQFIGISTFGVFSPLMLSLSFMVLGLQFGLSVFFMVLLASYVIRAFFERVELLYIPRLALLMSFLALSFFLILALALYMGTSLNLALTIFPMMVMSTISEKFIASQTKEGLKNAIIAALETILVALLAYMFVDWDWVKDMILRTPEWILVPMFGNVVLGKFTGLRLSEYMKFKSLLGDETQE